MQVGDVLRGSLSLYKYIGCGSQGECWLVRDQRQPEQFWLAKIYRLQQGNWDRYDVIEQEARLLRQLAHPMIPKFHDLFLLERESAVCLLREWIPGIHLEQYVEEKRLSEADVRSMAKKILNLLTYIHGLSPAVFHRDIKPSNIILRQDESLSLIDFGSVRDSLHATSNVSSVIGTYGYTPPEQFAGHPSTSSDLYALGATLIFLLSRHHPMHLPYERNRLQFEPYVNVQPRFLRILQRLLEPNVEDRFQTAAEVLRALERCESSSEETETTIPSPEPTPTPEPLLVTAVPHALVVAPSAPKRPWQRNRESDIDIAWKWERAPQNEKENSYRPDLSPLQRTLQQRYQLDQLDEYSESFDVIQTIDEHFGYQDNTGRQWILRLLHPYDAADLLFGYYHPDFLLPSFATSLIERFSLLHTGDSSNAIGQWTLLYFLHKHGWHPEELWYENQQLPLSYKSQRLSGQLNRTRRFLDNFHNSPIGQQAKRYARLNKRGEQIEMTYQLCVSLRPDHLEQLVTQGMKGFEMQTLQTYPTAWQAGWRSSRHLRWALTRILAWPPSRLNNRFFPVHSNKFHRLGAFVGGVYQLYHDLDLLKVRLREEYHWLLPPDSETRAPLPHPLSSAKTRLALPDKHTP